MKWECADATHRGKVRACNEDALISRPDAGLWAVADGMGGHHAGEVASQAIADSLAGVSANGVLADRVDCVEDVLLSINDALREHARSLSPGATIGSTVVTLIVEQCIGVALWAGDSRLYRQRSDSLEQITRDHNPISDLMEDGAVSEAEALAADTNVVTRAVGGHSDLHLDFAVFDVAEDDTFLLCSDGVYRECDTTAMHSALKQPTAQQAADALMLQVLSGPARDNLSLIVARAQSMSPGPL